MCQEETHDDGESAPWILDDLGISWPFPAATWDEIESFVHPKMAHVP